MTGDKIDDRVGRLIDAATKHVEQHGLTPKKVAKPQRVGRVEDMGRNVIPVRPSLPGLPKPKAKKGAHIKVLINDSRTRAKIVVSVEDKESWVVMTKEQFARFAAGCMDTLRNMIDDQEKPKP